MENKKLPVGIENFAEIRREDFYYIDKTGLIRDLLRDWGKVNLFTRPRRFGKTLNMSMLKCFFEIGTDASLFDGLAIAREKDLCEEYLGKCPVISLTLKGVDGPNFESAYNALRSALRGEVARLRFLLKSAAVNEADKQPLERFLHEQDTREDVLDSLKTLCALLYQHHGQKVILLIDEYDVPLDKAFLHGYYPEMVSLLRGLLGNALKTNDFLQFAVLTGCLRVARAALAALTETPWPYVWARPAPFGKASGPGLAGLPERVLEDLPDCSLPSVEANLRLLESVLAGHGKSPLYVDLTRADLNLPVVRVLIPGLELTAEWDRFSRPSLRLFARYAAMYK